jgi:Uma2 family endonuclease
LQSPGHAIFDLMMTNGRLGDPGLGNPPQSLAQALTMTVLFSGHERWPTADAARQLRRSAGKGRGGPGGWWILDEPELHLGDDVLVPDLAGWRRSRLPAVPETAYFTLAPDWICEVLAPGTARLDRQKKLAICAREGVAHAWLLDPIQRTLEILRLDGGHWVIAGIHADQEEIYVEPFDAIVLELSRLWAD